MNRIYFIRHGESIVNLTKEFSHRKADKPLTPKGEMQASQAAHALMDIPLSAIYCSPQLRAVQTAGFIAAPHDLTATPLEYFREINVGSLEDSPPTREAWALFGRTLQAWVDGQPELHLPNGENHHELCARFLSGVEHIIAENDGRDLLVVTHGGILILSISALCPAVGVEELRKADVPNCSITEVVVERVNGRLTGQLVRFADASHLHGEAAELVRGVPEDGAFIQ